MHPPPVSFYYDYVDPASYVLRCVLADLQGAEAVALTPVPLELRPPGRGRIDSGSGAWRQRCRGVEVAAVHFGVEITVPSAVPWSRKAHELALHAKAKGCFEAVHGTLFRAFFADGEDIGRIDVLVEIGSAAGLDATECKAVLDIDRFAHRVEEIRAEARDSGVGAAPALRSGDLQLQGLPNREGLASFLAAVRAAH